MTPDNLLSFDTEQLYVAFCEDKVNTEDWPAVMVVGLAVSVTVGVETVVAGAATPIVTLFGVAVPPSLFLQSMR